MSENLDILPCTLIRKSPNLLSQDKDLVASVRPSVCPSVCPFVCALPAVQIDQYFNFMILYRLDTLQLTQDKEKSPLAHCATEC